MSQALPVPGDCNESCSTPSNIGPPGVAGAAGTNGTNGDPGQNAWTPTTAAFVMPAELATVVVAVENSEWAEIGQIIFVGGGGAGGYFKVTAKPTTTSITLQNLEDTASNAYTSNSAPTTNFPIGSTVSPGGLQGPIGVHPSGALIDTNNLNDLNNFVTARNNLGLGTAALEDVGFFLQVASNLSDLNNVVTARTNLQLVKGIANTNTPQVDDAAGLVDDEFLRATATGIEGITPAVARVALNLGRAPSGSSIFTETYADTVAAGALNSGSWSTRILNTNPFLLGDHGVTAFNAGTGEITLAPGTYIINGGAYGYCVDYHIVRVWNVTDVLLAVYGLPSWAPLAGDAQEFSQIWFKYVVAGGNKVIRLEQLCQTTKATDGRGKACSLGVGVNVFAFLYIEKEAG